jgi:hypothetical protein
MDYVLPAEVISYAVRAAEKKAGLSARYLPIGVFLGYATSLAPIAVSQGVPAIAGANFALLPMAWMEGRVGMGAMLRNWSWGWPVVDARPEAGTIFA